MDSYYYCVFWHSEIVVVHMTKKQNKINIIMYKSNNETYTHAHYHPQIYTLQIFELNAPEPQIVFLGVVFLVSFLRVLVLFCPTLFEHTHQHLFKQNKRNDGGGKME